MFPVYIFKCLDSFSLLINDVIFQKLKIIFLLFIVRVYINYFHKVLIISSSANKLK